MYFSWSYHGSQYNPTVRAAITDHLQSELQAWGRLCDPEDCSNVAVDVYGRGDYPALVSVGVTATGLQWVCVEEEG